jgi:hypothetical protein
MKNKIVAIIGFLIFGFLFNSCEEFIEKELKDEWVYVEAPVDYARVDVLTQTLKWKEVEGADAYNLQVYRTNDNYLNLEEFIVDTNVRATQFTYTFKPGYYKWQIYAKNNGSESGLSVFHFQIDSSGDLSNQKVILLTPRNGNITDTLEQEFTWQSIPSASEYTFQIYPENSTVALLTKIVKNGTATNFTFPSTKATYRWRVFAMNGNIQSPYTEYKLSIDTTKLVQPIVISPKNDTAVFTNPVQLKWNGVLNATSYKVQISRDSTYAEAQMDISQVINATSYNFDKATTLVNYYWRVKAIKGGSEGPYTRWWLFRRK